MDQRGEQAVSGGGSPVMLSKLISLAFGLACAAAVLYVAWVMFLLAVGR